MKKPYLRASKQFRYKKPTDVVVPTPNGLVTFGQNHPLVVVAGRCSVENEEMIVDTALAVKAAGAYKPRTSPYAFQGHGESALELLTKAREATGLGIITEVMDTADLEKVASIADVVQIGARNMQSFSLLKKVGAQGKLVLLKRGLSATIEDWLMSAEYILAAGNPNVILCERGICTFDRQYTRNTLDISAIPVLRTLTHLPIMIDPIWVTKLYNVSYFAGIPAEPLIQESPVSVMVRGLLEKALCPQKLDELFERSAKNQYTRELLFSTLVNLMSLVVCGIHPSVHAAHQASIEEIGVSVTSVYNKLNGVEPTVSAELVREIASQLEATIRHLNATLPDLLPGYRVKIIDSNAIAKSEHRLKVLRQVNSAPLPGQSLVVLDPSLMLAVDVFPCEDGHAQERSLFDKVLPTVEEDDVWIADRNFCTLKFMFGIVAQKGYFIIRQHQSLPW